MTRREIGGAFDRILRLQGLCRAIVLVSWLMFWVVGTRSKLWATLYIYVGRIRPCTSPDCDWHRDRAVDSIPDQQLQEGPRLHGLLQLTPELWHCSISSEADSPVHG